ncbi:hypothetical protein D7Y15_11615 [Corallococcus sp. AB030]|uniref:SulP family inorganic anion transporter n=1 Tax=Corallococcus TaxID=83461 RepID=UPI000ED0DF7C|nr:MULTISPECIES: SulP family inorganic anion transporter [Corallococcus]NRD54886.1 hypothetical protein [Corallococcus exiguus]RKI16710.1 hypothetical protein D7Y15_11615 [Corallococcus sp. AB030]
MGTARSRTPWLTRVSPFVASLRGYDGTRLKKDLVGALTVTALHIPEGMAYAQLAGMPPQAALYSTPAALALYALFGSSRQLIIAVSASVSVLSAATVGAMAQQGTPRFVALTAALARVHAPAQRLLERTGVLAKVGRQNVYPHVHAGVEAWMARHESQAWQEWRLIQDGLYLVRSRVDEAGATLHGEERHRQEDLLIRLDEADTRMRELLRNLPHPPADDDSRGPVH